MSEYQYYEFVALDRPLTPAEMAELRSISTRAQITPTRFFNEYHWGDLKADPAELLVRYFDVHVYFANWGSRRLMFRLPKSAVNLDNLRACVAGGPATLTVTEHHVVLDLWSETEEPEDEWFEDGQLLASLTPLRAELLRGDRRVAYLAWLLAVQAGELDPDTPEPRVPYGLDGPSASLAAFTSFLRIDPDLLAAAAETGVEDTGEMEHFRNWGGAAPSTRAAAVAAARRRQSGRSAWLGAAGRVPPRASAGGWPPGTHCRAVAGARAGTACRAAAPVHQTGAPSRMADLGQRPCPPDGFPAAVISRVIIHVDGSPGAARRSSSSGCWAQSTSGRWPCGAATTNRFGMRGSPPPRGPRRCAATARPGRPRQGGSHSRPPGTQRTTSSVAG